MNLLHTISLLHWMCRKACKIACGIIDGDIWLLQLLIDGESPGMRISALQQLTFWDRLDDCRLPKDVVPHILKHPACTVPVKLRLHNPRPQMLVETSWVKQDALPSDHELSAAGGMQLRRRRAKLREVGLVPHLHEQSILHLQAQL